MLGTPTIRTEVTIRRVSYMVSPSSSVFIGLDIAGLENGENSLYCDGFMLFGAVKSWIEIIQNPHFPLKMLNCDKRSRLESLDMCLSYHLHYLLPTRPS